MAARLGNVLYWLCIALAGVCLLHLGDIVLAYQPGGDMGDRFVIGAMLLYALARGCRYVFAGR